MKIFAFETNRMSQFEDISGIAVSEEGEVLTGHLSSNIHWLKHDLGIDLKDAFFGTHPFKHDIYNKKFGEGNWSIEWLDVVPDELIKKIEEWKASHPN